MFTSATRAFRLLTTGLCLAIFCVGGMRPAAANDHYVIKQSTNSDCGPAALATLLNYYLDIPTTESEIARLSLANQYGTTLVGLEQATAAKGAAADSFRMDLKTLKSQMASYPAPVLVRLLLPEPHFVLLLDYGKRTFMMCDPSCGNIVMTEKAFLKRWLIPGLDEGYVLIASRDDERVNVARRNEVIGELQRQQQFLSQQHPAPAMRR
jgi:predicted double-glycine peptidase